MSDQSPQPGWYPSSDGSNGQRYWDGQQWSDAMPSPPAPPTEAPKKKRKKWPWIAGAAVVAVLIVIIAISTSVNVDVKTPADNAAESAARVNSVMKDLCRKSVKKQLRYPDSAQFSNEQVNDKPTASPPANLTYNTGDHYYIVIGTVNFKNGSGGYLGDSAYNCDAILHTDGKINAIASMRFPH